jgi:hypothetical protein
VYLPLILAFLGLFAGTLSRATPLGSTQQSPAQEPGTQPRVTVLAGTGEPDPEWVERVRQVVATELPPLQNLFDRGKQQPFFVFVHGDRDSLPAALAANLHADSPAFALLGQHQIHMVRGEIRRLGVSLTGVVRHELVHELLDQYVAPNGRAIPRWFHEGLAQHLAGDTYLRASEDDLVWRLGTRHLPSFGNLTTTFPDEPEALRVAYAQSFSYVSFLVREYGLDDLLAVARAADDFTSFSRVLVGRLGRSTYDLEEAWRYHVLHASGAPWRVAFDQCFTLSMVGILPVLVLALMRRLKREQRVREQLAIAEERAVAAAAAEAAAVAEARATDNDGNPDNTIESRPPPG